MAASPTSAEVQLALRLRGLREGAGLTQGELAALFSPEQKVGAASISSWENLRRPSSLPESRLEPYARLFSATPGTSGKLKLVSVSDLTPEHEIQRDELLAELQGLWDAARGATPTNASGVGFRSWFFDDDGPLAIVAPPAPPEVIGDLGDPRNPNYTRLHGFADLDALIELHGHIRAENEPAFPVRFTRASEVVADDLSGHLVLLGGTGWNELTDDILRRLTQVPVRQMPIPEVSSGEIFAVGHGKEEKRYLPEWSTVDKTLLLEDVGFLARVRNPYNSNRTLTLCNGIHSRGVLGAVRALTDARVRDSNESYLAERFGTGDYAILMRVPVFQGEALSPDFRSPDSILYEWPAGQSSRSRGQSAP